jgi:thioredoxin reductase (NADPH)
MRVTAAHIVIAVGGRPHIPADVPGAREHAITSDDIFSLNRRPGKTLCVGASYIALECAGFLTELGYDVTVAARSILLRGFDRQCAEKIGTLMEDLGTNIMVGYQPTAITKLPNGKLQVVFSDVTGGNGAQKTEVYDTVFYATGRTPDLAGLNLPAAGVQVAPSGKLPVTDERTNVPHIFAVGDVCEGKQELTPVAVRAGELLAKRLFGGATERMDYDLVATTVFTPMEYGTVGLSEEDAVAKYGEDDLEVYMFEFTTLELSAMHRTKHPKRGDDEDMGNLCLSKLVCRKSENERVVGFHYVGPNAGELTQGFALAVRLGATKADFDSMVGIHPTDAESFCSLAVTRRSGKSWVADGGCGGGVCG